MPKPQAPHILQIPIAEFDRSVLPPDAQKPGTDAFEQAVLTHFALSYAGKGWTALVTVDDRFIRVVAVPEHGMAPKDYVLGLLTSGFLEDALPMLEALDGMLDDPDIAYNHGVCLSELGRLEECIAPLRHCLELDPDYANAAVALGVAQARLGESAEALAALERAVALQPNNAFALRNLGSLLAREGRLPEALTTLRRAVEVDPGHPEGLYNLALCLEQLGGEHRREARALYEQLIKTYPEHPVVDAATARANRMANADLHDAVDGKPRMDAVMAMQFAMETFAKLPREEVGAIVMEIAKLGQGGLAINDPGRRYTLESLAGDFSGLQLLSLMHVGMKGFDPNIDAGTGLDREYEIAKGMR